MPATPASFINCRRVVPFPPYLPVWSITRYLGTIYIALAASAAIFLFVVIMGRMSEAKGREIGEMKNN
jgi:hypothetical protein